MLRRNGTVLVIFSVILHLVITGQVVYCFEVSVSPFRGDSPRRRRAFCEFFFRWILAHSHLHEEMHLENAVVCYIFLLSRSKRKFLRKAQSLTY